MSEKQQQTNAQTDPQADANREKLELNDFVDQNLEAIIEDQLRTEQHLDQHQRLIETLTKNVGRPRFLYLMLLVVALWVVVHSLLKLFGIATFDPPPFYWLQGLIGLSALSVTTMVLITQNRQAQQTERRRHLDLQVSLLVEQKVTKIISLLEELRRDIPSVHNRVDSQAEALQETVNPRAVLSTLEDMLQKDHKLNNEEAQNEQ